MERGSGVDGSTKVDVIIPVYRGLKVTLECLASVLAARFANIVLTNPRLRSSVMSKPSSTTLTVQGYMHEILAVNPKYALLMIGGNDVLFGVPDTWTPLAPDGTGGWKDNYKLIVSTLRFEGGLGDQPLGISRNTSAAYLLSCWVHWLGEQSPRRG